MITLSLASGTGVKGGTITLAVSIASTGGDQCSVIEFSLNHTSDVIITSATLGSAATAASKTLNQAGDSFAVWGSNANAIADGQLVIITFQISATPSTGSIPISFSGMTALSASSGGAGSPTTASNPGTVTVDNPSLSCPVGGGSATVGTFYSSALVPSAGTPPYGPFAITAGFLPPGLSLNTSTGFISGTPTTAGTWSYTAQVTDSIGGTATANCSIRVVSTPPPPPPLLLSCAASSATNSLAYSGSLIASGGTPGYTFSIAVGPLPTGLSLNSATGVISGTPTVNGVYPYTAKVVDSLGVTTLTSCSITVTGTSPPQLTMACALGGASVSIEYTGILTVNGGTGPFGFTLIGGMLPPGLTLDPTTGIISGIPTLAGTFVYTAQVTDSLGATAQVTCQIVVVNPTPPASGTCRTVLHLWQSAVAAQVEITQDRNDDWTDCGNPGLKFFQGFKLDADTFGNSKNIQIRDADTQSLHAPQPSPINHAGRQTKPYSFATPFLAHSVRRESIDSVSWRKFGITYEWQPSPEFTYTWKTQRTSHGLSGFHHIQRMLFAYASSANVTLTVTAFDGVSPNVITLPSTGGQPQKVVVVFSFNKGLTYQYSAISPSPFQIWKSDLEVVLGPWGRQGAYTNYPLIGGASGDSAEI